MAYFITFISEQIGRLEGKIDAIKADFVLRREFDAMQEDVDRAHDRTRDLEVRVRVLEVGTAVDKAENKGRFSIAEKVGGALLALATAATMAYLGLN